MKLQNLLLPARRGLLLCGRGGAVQHAEPVGGAPLCVSLRLKARHAVAVLRVVEFVCIGRRVR